MSSNHDVWSRARAIDWSKKTRAYKECAARHYGLNPKLKSLTKKLMEFERSQKMCSRPGVRCQPHAVQPYRGGRVKPAKKESNAERRAYEKKLNEMMKNLQAESTKGRIRLQRSRTWMDTASLAKLNAAAKHYGIRRSKTLANVRARVKDFEEQQRRCSKPGVRCQPNRVHAFSHSSWSSGKKKKKRSPRGKMSRAELVAKVKASGYSGGVSRKNMKELRSILARKRR